MQTNWPCPCCFILRGLNLATYPSSVHMLAAGLGGQQPVLRTAGEQHGQKPDCSEEQSQEEENLCPLSGRHDSASWSFCPAFVFTVKICVSVFLHSFPHHLPAFSTAFHVHRANSGFSLTGLHIDVCPVTLLL